MKLMSAAMIGCLGLLAQESSPQSDVFKWPVADQTAFTPIRRVVAPLLEDYEDSQQGDSKIKSKLHVAVALVQKDWAETLNNNEPVLEELKQLYRGVDVTALGGELEEVGPRLIFPESRAAVFSYGDYVKLFVRLRDLKLIESVKTEPVEDAEPEAFGPYSFERVAVTGLVAPAINDSTKSYGPFVQQTGSFSIGVGTDSRNENSVICDRKYTQFLETDWPTSSKDVDRQIDGVEHVGSRFELLPGEVAVLRWSPQENLRDGAQMMLGGVSRPNGEGAKDDTTFPIVVILNGDELPLPNIAQASWSKPLKTAFLQPFDYSKARQSNRGAEAKDKFATSRGLSNEPATAGGTSTDNAAKLVKPFQVTRVFRLQNIDVTEAAKLIEQLLADESDVRMVPDVRTNSLLASGSDEAMEMVEEVLTTLDVPPSPQQTSPAPAEGNGKAVQMEVADGGLMILKGSKDNVVAAADALSQLSSQQLSDRSKELEDKAASWVQKHVADAGKNDLAELRRTVTEDFEVRQRLQLAEIEFLKARLDDLERRVRQKQKLKSLIIDKRIEALLKTPAQGTPETATQDPVAR